MAMARAYSTGFDAHTHLDFPAFDGDRAQVMDRARAAGVDGWVIAGADPAHWPRVIATAAATGGIAVLGLHPWWVEKADVDAVLADLADALTPDGLGECGLDYARARRDADRDAQRKALRPQLALARERDVPVVLHCVRAYPDLLGILRRDGAPPGMVHGWTGPPDLVRPFLDLGLYLSFGTAIARPGKARSAVAAVPDDRLLLETDAPDRPLSGDRGEPADLVAIAAAAAKVRGGSAAEVLSVTGDNARRLFEG